MTGLNRAHMAVGSASVAEEGKPGERVSLVALFIAFLRVSLLGFGGGLVWARRIVVEQRRWTGDEEFTDILSLCQFMPGPNIIGIAVCVGARLRGLIGTIAAVSGFVLIPCMIGFSLGLLYLQYTHLAVLRNILIGVSSAAAGLLIGTGIRMLIPLRNHPLTLIVAAMAFGGMTFTKLPLLIVLFGVTLLSITVTQIEATKRR
jgi:chromate transporter